MIWNKLTKEMKDMYSENYKTWKKLKRTQRSGKISLALGLEELTLYDGHTTQKQYTYLK